MTEKLKACPFCGKKPDIDVFQGFYTVNCLSPKCVVVGTIPAKTEKTAINNWNKRHND